MLRDAAGAARWNHYLEYFKAQSKSKRRAEREKIVPGPVITVSRQAGAGAHSVAAALVPILQSRAPEGSCPWTYLDRSLVDLVIEEHRLPPEVRRFMPEDRVTEIGDTLDTLFGLHPTTWSLIRKTAETILHLSNLGNVIIIGRAGNLITANLPFAFHVRLVGSLEKRIRYIQTYKKWDRQAATDYVRTEDLGRRRYVKKYFGKNIDDPLLYDLVINTDRVSFEEAARLVADAVYPPKETAVPVAQAARAGM